MSRHRDAVVRLLEGLGARAAAAITAHTAEQLDLRGATCVIVDLLRPATAPELVEYKLVAELRQAVEAAAVADLIQADVSVKVTFEDRDARCVIFGGVTTVRRIRVARLLIRPRIKTRWVHIWSDFVRNVEWVPT